MIRNSVFALIVLSFSITVWANNSSFGVVGLDSAKVYSKPRMFSKKVTTIKYGDRVQIVSDKRGWLKISVTKKGKSHKGWIKSHVVETRGSRIAEVGKGDYVAKDGVDPALDESDIGTVGKGFDPQTEDAYRKDNRSKNFAAVDRLEKVKFDEMVFQSYKSFVKGGGLNSKMISPPQASRGKKRK